MLVEDVVYAINLRVFSLIYTCNLKISLFLFFSRRCCSFVFSCCPRFPVCSIPVLFWFQFHILCLFSLNPLLSLNPIILSLAWFFLLVRLFFGSAKLGHWAFQFRLHFSFSALQYFYLFIEFCFWVLDCLHYFHQSMCSLGYHLGVYPL